MEEKKRGSPLQKVLIGFFLIALFLAEISNFTKGANASPLILPIIMIVFGLIGAAVGGVLGGVIGLVGQLFKISTFKNGLRYGAAIGFMLLLSFWYLGCMRRGTAVCLPQ